MIPANQRSKPDTTNSLSLLSRRLSQSSPEGRATPTRCVSSSALNKCQEVALSLLPLELDSPGGTGAENDPGVSFGDVADRYTSLVVGRPVPTTATTTTYAACVSLCSHQLQSRSSRPTSGSVSVAKLVISTITKTTTTTTMMILIICLMVAANCIQNMHSPRHQMPVLQNMICSM